MINPQLLTKEKLYRFTYKDGTYCNGWVNDFDDYGVYIGGLLVHDQDHFERWSVIENIEYAGLLREVK